MNQCVPSWDNPQDQHNSSLPRFDFEGHPPSNSANSLPLCVPSLDYEVAELTWENGQLTMHGLGPPRLINKPATEPFPKYGGSWDRPAPPKGTLESLVDQATRLHPSHAHKLAGDDMAPWIDNHCARASMAAVPMDALVPCDNNSNKGSNIDGGGKENCQDSTHVLGSGALPGIGSCSGAGHFVGTGIDVSCCRTSGCASESATCGRGLYSCRVDTEMGGSGGVAGGFATSASMISAENTMSATAGKEYTKTSGEDHGSACHRRSQRERSGNDDRKKKGSGKSSISTKRSRAAAMHNQSERKRRDRINERMRTLQKLVPNSSKADKASMLDEAIEYLKQMQSQVEMMRRMVPFALTLQQQQLQMSMMATAPMGLGMGMGMPSPPIPPLAPLQQPSWDKVNLPADSSLSMADPNLLAFLACQSHPMNMEAYNRLTVLFQQFQNSGTSNAASGSSFKN